MGAAGREDGMEGGGRGRRGRGLRGEIDAAEELLFERPGDLGRGQLALDSILEALDGRTTAERASLRQIEPMAKTPFLPRDEAGESGLIPVGFDRRDDFSGYAEDGILLFDVPQLRIAVLPRPERFLAHASMSTCSLVVGRSETALVAAHVSYSLRRQAEAAMEECRREGCSDIWVVASVGEEQEDGHEDRVGLSGPKVESAEAWRRLGAGRVVGFEHSFEDGRHRNLVHAAVTDHGVHVFEGDYDGRTKNFGLSRARSFETAAVPLRRPQAWERLEDAARLTREILNRHVERGGAAAHPKIVALSGAVSSLLDGRAAHAARKDPSRLGALSKRFEEAFAEGNPASSHPETWVVRSALAKIRAEFGRNPKQRVPEF